MATLDSSILVVGLPQVVVALNTNLVVGVWFITIYRLMITVLLVGIGRIADLYGRVRMYNLGFAIFTVGSLLSGLSMTAEELWLSDLFRESVLHFSSSTVSRL